MMPNLDIFLRRTRDARRLADRLESFGITAATALNLTRDQIVSRAAAIEIRYVDADMWREVLEHLQLREDERKRIAEFQQRGTAA